MNDVHRIPLNEVPFAIVDVETTGLRPGWDRVTEVAVIHMRGANVAGASLAFDSLVHPGEQVRLLPDDGGVSGITPALLQNAPHLEDVAEGLLDALRGRVVVGHNVAFDKRFLRAELARVGVDFAPPTLCTLALLPAAGLMPRLSLDELRTMLPLPRAPVHAAAVDAHATAWLASTALTALQQQGARTLGDVARRTGRAVSLDGAPSSSQRTTHGMPRSRLVPTATVGHVVPSYAHALRDAIADFHLDDQEVARLRAIQHAAPIAPARLRALHAGAFAWALHVACDDADLSDTEAAGLSALAQGLRALGWAPT